MSRRLSSSSPTLLQEKVLHYTRCSFSVVESIDLKLFSRIKILFQNDGTCTTMLSLYYKFCTFPYRSYLHEKFARYITVLCIFHLQVNPIEFVTNYFMSISGNDSLSQTGSPDQQHTLTKSMQGNTSQSL